MINQAANISLIIPAYNRAGLIGETLWGLLNQTVPAKEIIVVDDGSTDGTADKTQEAFENWKFVTGNLKKDGREQFSATSTSGIEHPILKILHQANAGPGAARNRGLAEATGEFIHFFDSDDIAAPNKQDVQLRALLETGADIAYGPWIKGRFVNLTTEDTENTEEKAVLRLGNPSSAAFSNPSTSELARHSENPSLIRSADGPAEGIDAGLSTLDAGPWNFVPEGPVLQAQGLPEGDLVRALLTNWSIVPHACLFRRSILEKAGGFPEDIWVGEDQLLFLRCLLVGARVVHTPETMVYYRVGNDPGKLTATGSAQKRHARDWGRFLLKANLEVTSAERRVVGQRKYLITECTTERPSGRENRKLGKAEERATESWPQRGAAAGTMQVNEQTQFGLKGEGAGTTELKSAEEAPIPATRESLNVTRRPSAWFGFRLRAYEAWRDLDKFFPDGENELKNELQGIWRRNQVSGFRFQVSGFMLRKWGGLRSLILGHRVKRCFQPRKLTSI